MISLNEPGEKRGMKCIFNYKKPVFWLILVSVVLIATAGAIFLSNAAKRANSTIVPADVKLFKMEIKDYFMEQYIADFESSGEMQYRWITDAVEFNSYFLLINQHFKNNTDVSTIFRKYDSDFFQTNCLMVITLRSDSNITCLYNGDYKAKKQLISFSNKKGVATSYEFAYGNLLPSFSLEYLWLKNDSDKTDQSNWWLSFVEFNNNDFEINPSAISPAVVSRENSGNTDDVSVPSEPVIPVVLSSAESTVNTVSNDIFYYPDSFEENGKYGAIGSGGKILVPAQYDYLTTKYFYRDNMELYVLQNNQWGAITLDADMNASEPDWSTKIPEDIMELYTHFTQPVYAASDFETLITMILDRTYSFDILASENDEISDMEMAMFAAIHMPNYNYDNGNTRAEYDAVTLKYFGRTLTDYTGEGILDYIPGTDRLQPSGWGDETDPDFILLSAPLQKEGEVYTGLFDCYYQDPFDWDYELYDWETTKQLFHNRDWKPFLENGCAIDTLEIKFSLGKEKDGTYYPIFYSVKYK